MNYDYVVVGAGSAGCVLANRLTEDPDTTVLLVEAGGDDNRPDVRDPGRALGLGHTDVDWDYSTEPEPHLDGRRVYWPRGRVLGGSSSTNYMAYSRGSRYDYDHWRELGNAGWGYADVLPYFKKAENRERGASAYHGAGGPLNVYDPPEGSSLVAAFIEAGADLGWPSNPDHNGVRHQGFGRPQFTLRGGRRDSAATAYLHPVEQRPNLTVWTHALACRVVVEGGRAVGVVCERNGREQRVGADVEVVLSCGAVNTPQLLLLSGIGPADRLRALDLPLAADLPGVGGNLQDHLGIFTYHRTVESFSDFAASPQDTGLAFVSTRPDEPQADLEILFAPVYFPSGQPDSPPPAGSGFTIVVSLQRPESRGRLELRSADPHDRVAIHASYLSEDHDLRVLIEGVRIARRLSESSALSPVVRRAEVPGLVRDREIAELIRAHAATLFHPAGTCKMGRDDHAVVDEELRVHALEGLRVVDASIMPTVPGGHINAPTIAIAEKGADLIIASRAR